jgi:hypothetical protein
MWEVDEFDRMFKNFERLASTVSYSLYRCTMDNGELRWHI